MTNPPDISSLVSALPEGTIPPRYAPLLQLLGTMLKEEDDDEPEVPASSYRVVARLRQRLRLQTQRLARAQRMIRSYREQNRLLARAHGACECWGGNPSCADCGGRGSAGWTEPDRALVQELFGGTFAASEPPDQPRPKTTNNDNEERGR